MTGTATTAGPVGFVGLGAIGEPMARRLGAEHDLVVHDLDRARVDGLVAAGARAAGSVAEVAGQVGVLHVVVRDDDQVRSVLAEVLHRAVVEGLVVEGLVVVVHSTVAPGTPEELAALAAPHGVHVLDAPVSGGAVGAAEGTLAVMVGGDAAAYSRAEASLRMLGSLVVHAGPVGAGTRMKLARNLVHFASFVAVTEAQRLAEASGLDLLELGRVVRHSDAVTGGPGAIMHRATAAPLGPDDPWRPILGHVAALGGKDLGFALDLADGLDVDLPLARLAHARLAEALGLGAGA